MPTKQELRDEISADPLQLGFALYVANGQHGAIAAILMQPGLSGTSTVAVSTITAMNALMATVPGEYVSLTALARDFWTMILTVAAPTGLELRDLQIRAQVSQIWAPGTQTRANLVALMTRPASRVEQLWGIGATVTQSDVSLAMGG